MKVYVTKSKYLCMYIHKPKLEYFLNGFLSVNICA